MTILNERLTARPEPGTVVFLIGMRINRPWKLHRWFPVASAMPRMLRQLMSTPGSGLLGGDVWFGRTILTVQYWESVEKLIAFAQDPELTHVPAWRDFNRRVGTNGDVGIFHETYIIQEGQCETVYVNMPATLLGKATRLVPASGPLSEARDRLGKRR